MLALGDRLSFTLIHASLKLKFAIPAAFVELETNGEKDRDAQEGDYDPAKVRTVLDFE